MNGQGEIHGIQARKALADPASWEKGTLAGVGVGEVRIATEAGLSVAYECPQADRLHQLVDTGRVRAGDTVLVSERWRMLMVIPRSASGTQPAEIAVHPNVVRIEGGSVVAALAADEGPEPQLFGIRPL